MDLLTMNRLLTKQLSAALDEVDRLRDMLAAERADRERERRETDAALSWGEAA